MARITLRQLLDHAAEHGYGVPAFNINNMEQGLAIMEAAAATDAPVIIQASRGARAYANDIVLAKLIEVLIELYPDIPVCMHQDHGNSEATCYSAIQYGFSSVMMDGSLEADAKTPASYDYNVAITAKVAKVAHLVGASVEGELGVLGSLELGTGEQEDGHGAEVQPASNRANLLTLLFPLSTKWAAATRFIDQCGKYATVAPLCEDVWRPNLYPDKAAEICLIAKHQKR